MTFSADPKDPQFWVELIRDDIHEARQYGVEIKVAEGELLAIQRDAMTGNVLKYKGII